MVIEFEEFGEQGETEEQQENGSGNSEEEEEEDDEAPQIRRQQGQIRMVTSSGAENVQTTEETAKPTATAVAQQAPPQSPTAAAAAPQSPAPTQRAAPASPAPVAAAPQSPAAAGAAAAAQQAALEEAKRRQQEAMEKARAEALRLQEEARARAEAARQQHQQAAEQARLQAEQQLKAQQEAAKRQAEERAQQMNAQQKSVQVQQQKQQQQTAQQQKTTPGPAETAAAQQPTKAPQAPKAAEQPKQQQPPPKTAAAPAPQQQPKAAAPQPKAAAVAASPKPTAPPPAAPQMRAPPPVVREVQLPEAPSNPILRHAEYTPKLVDSSVNKLPPGQEPEEEQLEPSSVPRNPIIEDNAWQVQRRVQPEYQPIQPAKLNATGDFLVESEAKKSIVPEAVGYSKTKWNEFPEEEEKERQSVPKVKAQEWVPEHDVEHHVQKTVYQPGRIGPDPTTGRLWPPPGYGEEEQMEIGKGEKTKCIADDGWILANGTEPAEEDGEVGNAPWKGHTHGGDVKGRQWPPAENAVEKETLKGGRINAQWPPPEQEEIEQQRVEILQTHIPVKDKVREWKPRSLFPQYEQTETTGGEGA